MNKIILLALLLLSQYFTESFSALSGEAKYLIMPNLYYASADASLAMKLARAEREISQLKDELRELKDNKHAQHVIIPPSQALKCLKSNIDGHLYLGGSLVVVYGGLLSVKQHASIKIIYNYGNMIIKNHLSADLIINSGTITTASHISADKIENVGFMQKELGQKDSSVIVTANNCTIVHGKVISNNNSLHMNPFISLGSGLFVGAVLVGSCWYFKNTLVPV